MKDLRTDDERREDRLNTPAIVLAIVCMIGMMAFLLLDTGGC